jgi:hypothetical protein
MGTITAQSLIDKASTILQDAGAVRWTAAELLGWLNEGQRFIYHLRKDSSAKVTTMALAAGTRQTVPAEADLLLDIPRNATVSGTPAVTTYGRALRKISQPLLDAQYPDWHLKTPQATAKEYMYDPRVPKVFYVYPPSDGTGYVELKYSVAPAEVAAAANPITLDNVYATVLLDWMLMRAYAKETEESLMQRASLYRQSVESQLGAKGAVDEITNAQAVEA